MKLILRRVTPVSAGNEVSVVLELCGDRDDEREQVEYRISAEQYGEMRFLWPAAKAAGREITEEDADALAEADTRQTAYRRGLDLLSYGDCTACGLCDKLRRRGIPREAAEWAVARLAERGYLDEEKLLSRMVSICLRKGWGRRRIFAACMDKRFSSEAMENLDDLLADVDFVEACGDVIARKWGTLPNDPADRRRAIASLERLGYSWNEIKAAGNKP